MFKPKPDPDAPRVLLTQREACVALSVSAPTIRELTRSGRLPVVRIGRAVRYRLADLEAFGKAEAETPDGRSSTGDPKASWLSQRAND